MADDKWVYSFAEGDRTMADLLGGKGAGLAEMTNAGLLVPPGFTITTEACSAYNDADRQMPKSVLDQTAAALEGVEQATGKALGAIDNPLLLSVRSGAPVSMPGMMDTILNLGLNGDTTEGLGKLTGDAAFAWESYRRFVCMFGEIVLGVPAEALDDATDNAKKRADGALTDEDLISLVDRLKLIVLGYSRKHIPDDPQEQLHLAIAAVFDSWRNRRAVDYRKVNGIPDDLGTAVSVQAMVFGNLGTDSGTGVAFTRNPSDGQPHLYGEFLPDAQGEDVVAGTRTPLPITRLGELMPDVYDQLVEIASRLEDHYAEMQDLEFTVERGTLYMLQARRGKRTGRAAVRIAVDLVEEGKISKEEAVTRVTPAHVEHLLHPVVADGAEFEELTSGLPASPGAASGVVVFDADEAELMAADGQDVVLVRHETKPDDFHGMVAARAIVTSRGGVTSHAAVVARGMGTCCVVGCSDLEIDYGAQMMRAGNTEVAVGDWITVDGNNGRVLLGHVETVEPELDQNYETLMSWADEFRRLGVRTNADTPHDAEVALRFGAEGIGLCRTEHMFFQADRIETMREMIMAPNPAARADALERLEPYQIEDFEGMFEAMNGHPVTIRLLDPPLHEFLPRQEEILVRLTDLKLQLAGASDLDTIDTILSEINDVERTLQQVERLSESNPMLGHRGVRLGITYPEITEMQVRAIFTAAVRCTERGVAVFPEVMIPLVGFSAEFESQEVLVRQTAEQVFEHHGMRVEYQVGTMIELPRAALVADAIAEHAEFFSFGTNDLTQTTLGVSRDDASKFLSSYVQRELMEHDPFRTLDLEGVGALVTMACQKGREVRPDLKLGICGEHGGDPASIAFCHNLGLDYVSCSPYRVPVARLAAARAALGVEH